MSDQRPLFPLGKYLEAVYSGLVELWSHKMRSLLTLFGIIMGTLALIVMTSMLSSTRNMVESIFSAISWDGMLEVRNDVTKKTEGRQTNYKSEGLTVDDADALKISSSNVIGVAPIVERPKVIQIKGDNLNINLRGTTVDFLTLRNRKIKSGRFITDMDLAQAAQVCIISEDLETKYFYGSALDQEISYYSIRCRIVGVIEKLKNDFHGSFYYNEANVIIIPITTLQKYMNNKDQVDRILIKIKVDNLDQAVSDVERKLEILHKGVHDFAVENMAQEIMRAQQESSKMLQSWNYVLGTIASVSLLVGGIGILSIMLIAISERIFEIGLRKSMGATDAEIFLQFIIESITLSLVGALSGATIGISAVAIIASKFPFKLSLSTTGVGLAMIFAITIGIMFGWYPAHKASALQPVEALRK